MFACLRTFRPSAYACISPYSIPLWTIFTKWPAPEGPQCSQPCSSGDGSPLRPGVRTAASTPGAGASPGGERLQHGREPVDGLVVTADHQAVTALAAPDAAADADVDVVDA